MPRVKLVVREVGSESNWEEEYEGAGDPPEEWAQGVIQRFNAGLRPGESARELVSVIVLSEGRRPHCWRKSSLTTQFRGSVAYDEYVCTRCGVTGKRFGLDAGIKLDNKYRSKKSCV